MKRIILIAIILMCGTAYAHDPNDLVSAENRVHVEVTGNIMQVTVLLNDEQLHVYQRTNPMTDIINSIKKVMQRRIELYRRAWLESQNTTDME